MYKSSHLLANVLIVPKVAFVLRFVFIMYTRFARNYHNKPLKRSAAALVKKVRALHAAHNYARSAQPPVK